jgi:hyaluronan synthase
MVSKSPSLSIKNGLAATDRYLWLSWAVAIALVAGILILFFSRDPMADFKATEISGIAWSMSGIILLVFGLRIVLWLRYRPLELPADDSLVLPTLTVVIPAFNEGPMVGHTIESILCSDYPADKLRVIVVNDGSHDDTGASIDLAAARHPEQVIALHLPENRGKRHALYAGFSLVTSELIATVDSDCTVPSHSLLNLVAPFLLHKTVAGVAGKVLVHNRAKNFLTRMLGVRYILGFDFTRAYQSQLRTVWCCPGALQAYRTHIVAPHLEAWRDQTFLGARCTNGDDHAMTNLVLSLGHDTVYQSNAPVETLVPHTYGKLSRMYIRWGRSATREGLRALAFAPKRLFKLGFLAGPVMLLDAIAQPLFIGLRLLAVLALFWLVSSHPQAFLTAALATTLVALIYGIIFLRSERSTEVAFGICYAFFAAVCLPWIQPFATLTVRGNAWLTRG